MKKYYVGSSVLFIIVAIVALLSRNFGWYNSYWYTDVILHFISGIAFGLLCIALNSKTITSSPFVFFISIVSFAVFGSVLWEFWEYAGWHLTPSHTQFYIPQLADTLSDIFCGLIGGVCSGLLYLVNTKLRI